MSKNINDNIPQDVLEMKVLGCVLKKNDVIVNISDIIKEHMFTSNLRANIYHVMSRLYSEKTYFNEEILLQYMIENNLWDNTVPHIYISKIKDSVTSSLLAKSLAESIKRRFYKKTIKRVGQEFIDKADELNHDQLEQFVDSSLLKIKSVDAESKAIEKVYIIEDDLISSLSKKIDSTEVQITGLRTGYLNLDRRLDGLIKGTLTNLTADSSVGKSTLANNVAINVCRLQPEANVLIISAEMMKKELEFKHISQLSGISSKYLKHPKLYFLNENDEYIIDDIKKQEFLSKIKKATGELNKLNIFVDETSTPDILDVETRVKRFKMQHGRLDFVIVDHTDIILCESAGTNEVMRLKMVYQRLKKLAKDLNVPIWALHQFNNELKNIPDRRPNIFLLKGASDIRQNCDNVLLLYRPEVYDDLILERPDLIGVCDLTYAKLRDGEKLRPTPLSFNGILFKEK